MTLHQALPITPTSMVTQFDTLRHFTSVSPKRPKKPSVSHAFGSATFRSLYPEETTKVSISQLEPIEMVWLAECLKSPVARYYTESELQRRTELIISSLPKHLRNPLGKTNQAQLTRFFRKIGASANTLPLASALCPVHHALSGQLTASARNLLEYCAEDLVFDLMEKVGRKTIAKASTETFTLLHDAQNVMSLSLSPEDFQKTYKRPLPGHLHPDRADCDACVLKHIASSPDMLCGLRGVALHAANIGLGTDDCGNKRAKPCKTFVEACMATYSREDAVLLFQLSDTMAAELEHLSKIKSGIENTSAPLDKEAEKRPTKPQKQGAGSIKDVTHEDPHWRHMDDSDSDIMPLPLNIGLKMKKHSNAGERAPLRHSIFELYHDYAPNYQHHAQGSFEEFGILDSLWCNFPTSSGTKNPSDSKEQASKPLRTIKVDVMEPTSAKRQSHSSSSDVAPHPKVLRASSVRDTRSTSKHQKASDRQLKNFAERVERIEFQKKASPGIAPLYAAPPVSKYERAPSI